MKRPLQIGIAHLCSSNTFGDTAKYMKIFIFQFLGVLKEMTKNGKNCKRDRIDFLAIFPKLFELQRPKTHKNTQKWPKNG